MKIPIKAQYFLSEQSDKETLLVFLPGIGDKAEAFRKKGFIDQVQNHAPHVDIVSVEAHFKYYQSRTVIQRLREDVILPAKQKGYKRIVLAGISLGGYGSLLYLRKHPDDISNVILLSPYLGEPEAYNYLIQGKETTDFIDEGNIWPWITHLSDTQKERITLAFGDDDKFNVAHKLLQKNLPEENTLSIEGGHNWTAWKIMWPRLLVRSPL